ncbi:MAG: deoxynucleoside kinase [Bacteroidales bacterium]|nr:deoxynucleoside kinase [Bacteroidales bacterium]
MHIGIAGNIGSGKTSLTRMLSEHYGWTPQYEAVTYNPYLEDYYKDIQRWSFNLEVYFLTQRFKDLLDIAESKETVIQDRTVMEGVSIFVENNRAMGNISERDYQAYMELFRVMMRMVRLPDLLIYLRCSVPHLVGQIQKRGRDYEQGISLEYLKGLNDRYEKWIADYKGKVIVIDSDNLDFVNKPEDFFEIINIIDAELFGLFSALSPKGDGNSLPRGN